MSIMSRIGDSIRDAFANMKKAFKTITKTTMKLVMEGGKLVLRPVEIAVEVLDQTLSAIGAGKKGQQQEQQQAAEQEAQQKEEIGRQIVEAVKKQEFNNRGKNLSALRSCVANRLNGNDLGPEADWLPSETQSWVNRLDRDELEIVGAVDSMRLSAFMRDPSRVRIPGVRPYEDVQNGVTREQAAESARKRKMEAEKPAPSPAAAAAKASTSSVKPSISGDIEDYYMPISPSCRNLESGRRMQILFANVKLTQALERAREEGLEVTYQDRESEHDIDAAIERCKHRSLDDVSERHDESPDPVRDDPHNVNRDFGLGGDGLGGDLGIKNEQVTNYDFDDEPDHEESLNKAREMAPSLSPM